MPPLLTYEKICRLLVKSARRSGLHVYGEEHILEFHTAGRSFEFFCAPKGYGPPYNRRARVSFFWPSEQHVRVYSVEEDDLEDTAIDSDESDVDDEDDLAGADSDSDVGEEEDDDGGDDDADDDDDDDDEYDDLSFIELVVDYDIVGTREEHDLENVTERAETAFGLVVDGVGHDNAPVLHMNVGVQPGGKKFVEQCYVTYYWEVDIFEGDFDTSSIFDEVRDVLKMLIENDDSPGPGRKGKGKGGKGKPPRSSGSSGSRLPRFSDN